MDCSAISYVVHACVCAVHEETGHTLEIEEGKKIAGFPSRQEAKDYIQELRIDLPMSYLHGA